MSKAGAVALAVGMRTQFSGQINKTLSSKYGDGESGETVTSGSKIKIPGTGAKTIKPKVSPVKDPPIPSSTQLSNTGLTISGVIRPGPVDRLISKAGHASSIFGLFGSSPGLVPIPPVDIPEEVVPPASNGGMGPTSSSALLPLSLDRFSCEDVLRSVSSGALTVEEAIAIYPSCAYALKGFVA